MNSKEFMEKMLEADRIICERQAKDSEYRKKNNAAWEYIESELQNVQGDYRSNAYQTYKAYSISMCPVSESMLNKMYSQMSTNEYSLLKQY